MQNSQAYIEFIKQTKAMGRERMEGYNPRTLDNIYDWEREEVEDIIWYRFVEENDSDLSIFMPKLNKYNGIESLKRKLDTFAIPSGASFNIAETLYIATNENKYFRVMMENYNTTSNKVDRIQYVSCLSRLAKKHEVYDKLIEIYINDDESVNQSTAIQGILWADGYIRNLDDMDEVIKKIQLLKKFKRDCKEDRNAVITEYKKSV